MINQIKQRMEWFKQMLCCVDAAYLTEFGADFTILSSTAPHPQVLERFFLLGNAYEGENFADREIDEEWKRAKVRPTVFANSLGMAWISDVWISHDKVERIYLLGPVFLDDWSVEHIERELNQYQLSVSLKHRFMDYIRELPVLSLNRFYEYGIMMHYCIWEEKLTVSDYSYPDAQRLPEQEQIFKLRHGTLAAEQEILRLVEEGNPDYQKRLDHYISVGNLGDVGGGKYLRQQKNTVIMFTTLCSRAAIRGGLPSETAYSLCDSYLYKVEQAQDLATLTLLNREMFRDFVMRVHRRRASAGQISPQIQRVCDAICLHLEMKVDIHTLAEQLGYTDYYFSNKFKQEVGMSVRDFAMRQKVEKAKIMLRDSNVSVQEISAALGYGSQSYFGEVFRKLTGMTPVEYKNQTGKCND